MTIKTLVAIAVIAIGIAVASLIANQWNRPKAQDHQPKGTIAVPPVTSTEKSGLETATFGSGCFWCTEAVFIRLKGVSAVKSGYSGGSKPNPTYEEVCGGNTGHAEAVQITFDPRVISFVDLLEVFWKTHDPTTMNRQGNDHGTQYRSVVFFHNDDQRKLAEEYKQKLDKSGAFDAPIVTEITAYQEFYPAEDYHQNFYFRNPRQPYCAATIPPKLEKLKKVFGEKLKSPDEK